MTSETASPLTDSTCPRCSSIDRVQRISTIIDAGITSTSGVAFKAGGDTTTIQLTGQSALVSRFKSAGKPMDAGTLGCFTWFFAVGAWTALTQSILFGLLASVATCVLIGVAWNTTTRARREWWLSCNTRLREGYYCLRDDVAFDTRERVPHSPEDFVRACFPGA